MGISSGSSSRKRTRGDEERAEERAEERKMNRPKSTPLPTRKRKRRRYATGIDYAAMARSGFDEDVEGGPRARSAATVDYKAILSSKTKWLLSPRGRATDSSALPTPAGRGGASHSGSGGGGAGAKGKARSKDKDKGDSTKGERKVCRCLTRLD
ncbi:hypothetical protein T484DRAFT_1921683 [Baffinella frigidus]|nr:hypothetical protein T484DRAFT_1921683 [Cryptophyta sp. CCMP2293]